MSGAGDGPTRVGIGLIARGGRYLIRRRPELPGSPMPGYWEFPGGKCDAEESAEACVAREILEEAGLVVVVERVRNVVEHAYPHGHVILSFCDCRTADPAAEPVEGTGFVWVDAAALGSYTFPGANEGIVRALIEESAGRGGG